MLFSTSHKVVCQTFKLITNHTKAGRILSESLPSGNASYFCRYLSCIEIVKTVNKCWRILWICPLHTAVICSYIIPSFLPPLHIGLFKQVLSDKLKYRESQNATDHGAKRNHISIWNTHSELKSYIWHENSK